MGRTETAKNKDIKNTVRDAVRESVMEMNLKQSDDDFDGPATNNNFPQGSIQDPVADDVAFDVFSDVGEDRFKKGLITRYAVKKNGQHLATLEHPLSWDKVREKFGAGHYQVVAKDGLTGAYLKWQTQMLGELPQEMLNDDEPQHTPQNSDNGGNGGMNFFQIMQMMETKAENARREAREEARAQAMAQAEQTKAFFSTFATMMQSNNKPDTSANVQIEMMKMMQQMTEKLADNQREMFKEINKKIEDVSKKGKDDLSLTDVLKLAQDQQNKGFDMYSKFYTLAEKIAEDKVESIEEARSSGSGNGEGDSLTTTLIKSVAPLLAAAAAQQAGQQPMQQMIPQAPPQLPQRRTAPQHRGSVKRSGSDGTQIPQPRNSVSQLSVRGRGPTTRTAPTNATNKKTETRPTPNVGGNVGENSGAVSITETDSGLPTLNLAEIEQKTVEVILVDPQVKQKAIDILPVFLGNLMLEAVEPREAAARTTQFLSDNGIGRDLFLANVSLEDIITVANKYAADGVTLPQEAFAWLNDLYAYIQNPA